jgi:hypothetical protein
MPFVSQIQPLCRYCAAPIKKHTHTVWFGMNQMGQTGYSTHMPDKPKSKAEAQRLVNQQIVSIGWSHHWVQQDGRDVKVREYIDKITTWDGESYVDEFFCNAEHARWFGYAAVRGGNAMPAYHDAIAARDQRG